MGLRFGKSSDDNYQPPNPNPGIFKIVSILQVNDYVVALINYPGCTTHNGNKVLVFKGTEQEILNRKVIDPHFLDGDESLLARFPATLNGYKMAIFFANSEPIYE